LALLLIPVAMGIAEQLGGIPALAAVLAIVTGIIGALTARGLFTLIRMQDMRVRGFALGTASHGIGAARALQVDANAGAYAGVALGLQVFVASILLPLLASLLAAVV
jgi:putative effector of murein hydrolase